jgi:3-deoxy-7-phosphoheptulonate synthase
MDVGRDIAAQIAGGSRAIFGVMAEGNIQPGAQKFTPGQDDPSQLEYGKSITDGCLGWDDTVTLIDGLAQAVQARRGH